MFPTLIQVNRTDIIIPDNLDNLFEEDKSVAEHYAKDIQEVEIKCDN